MEPLPEPANTGWPFPFTPQDWEQTPPAVQAYLRTVRRSYWDPGSFATSNSMSEPSNALPRLRTL